jgi:hypothetical protein
MQEPKPATRLRVQPRVSTCLTSPGNNCTFASTFNHKMLTTTS